MVAGSAGTDEELEDSEYFSRSSSFKRWLSNEFFVFTALHIEWSKAWARSRQWTEEVHLLEEEWRRLPLSYVHCEQTWIRRAIAVPVSMLESAVMEGLIAYATKQAQLYCDLTERAETTRTEVKLSRGKKQRVWQASWDPIISRDAENGAVGGDDEEGAVGDKDKDKDDEHGDIESDEELLMGREVDDD
jgi:hypothetical protein